jgi:hypothetical protein
MSCLLTAGRSGFHTNTAWSLNPRQNTASEVVKWNGRPRAGQAESLGRHIAGETLPSRP